jgi:hypothetical protein
VAIKASNVGGAFAVVAFAFEFEFALLFGGLFVFAFSTHAHIERAVIAVMAILINLFIVFS